MIATWTVAQSADRGNRRTFFISHSFFLLAKERTGEERKRYSSDASLCWRSALPRIYRGVCRARVPCSRGSAESTGAYFVKLPARGASREEARACGFAQIPERLGNVDALSARVSPYGLDAVDASSYEDVGRVGYVDGGVKRKRVDHRFTSENHIAD